MPVEKELNNPKTVDPKELVDSSADSLTTIDAKALAIEFLTPRGRRGYRKPAIEQSYVDDKLPFNGGHLALRRWGAGKPVLLVHGWSGSQSDLHGFVPAIVAAGFSAVTLDLPAHGDSSGDTASLDHLAEGVVAAAKYLGELRSIIAHSVGCAATLIATAQGISVERIVFIAPPESYETAVREFAAAKDLNKNDTIAFIEELRASGVRVAIFASEYLANLKTPGLLIHSSDDDIVRIETGKRVAELWQNCKFVEVHGLGHRKILRDAEIIEVVRNFITDQSVHPSPKLN